MKKLLIFVLALVSSGWAQTSVTGALTASAASCTSSGASCTNLALTNPETGAVGIDLSGTFVGTAQFEASFDGKAWDDSTKTWRSISVTPVASTTTVTSATAGGAWRVAVSGMTDVRVRCSAFTSGTIVVALKSSVQAASLGGGGTAVYASGNGTSNVIPKGNGAGQLADSSITDDATTVTTAEILNLTKAADTTNAIIRMNSTAAYGVMFGASTLIGLKVDAGDWLAVSNSNPTSNGAQIPNNATFSWSSSATFAGNASDTNIGRAAAGIPQVGIAASATPAARTFQVGESSRAGTDSNVAGSAGTIRPGVGTGTGAGAKFCIQRNLMGASGSTAQSVIDGYCVGPSKTLSNTTATAQSLANISVPSNSAGGVFGTITVTCTDGTNFDSETQSFNVSYVNKATVLTVGTPAITTSTAANNSGSCTAGITAVAGTNSIDIKVTPVLTTIVPTTVTSYIELMNHGTGNVTFN